MISVLDHPLESLDSVAAQVLQGPVLPPQWLARRTHVANDRAT
jgi:hypothetical protein